MVTIIICTIALGAVVYFTFVGGGGVLIASKFDVFAPPPENVTKDVQERADRVENSVNNTLSGKVSVDDAKLAIENEGIRASACSMSYSGKDFDISAKYRKYLSEAEDVVITSKGNQTNQTSLANEIAQMHVAKQNLY